MAHGKAIQSSFTLRERQRRKTDDRSETEEAEDADEEPLQPTLAAGMMPKNTELQALHIS
eukprot:symbB.v1.2.007079.t1/scaffold433.1/size205709/1